MIALGLGCRRGCSSDELTRVVREALAAAGRELSEVQALYAPDWKHDEAGLIAAARALGKPLVLLPLSTLGDHGAQTLSRSAAVLARFGVPSIAETAALAGAQTWQRGSRLLGPRHSTAAASCALATPLEER